MNMNISRTIMPKIKHNRYLRRRQLATTQAQGEWEDDDAGIPFHLQGDDATREHMINDSDWEKAANKGIIYSNNTGSKEIQVIKEEGQQSSSKRPPPPPPPPPIESTIANEKKKKKKQKNIVKDIIQDHETNIKNEKSNELYKVDPNYNPSKELNQTIMEDNNIISSDNNIQADTILDDLLRGFTFAAFFCLVLYLLYKLCYCTCVVKCGFFPMKGS